jgi:signal transduction histidine kinase
MNVLVVEDDRVTRMLQQRYLSDWGHTVHIAVDGQEAYEFISQPELPTPLIILLDWVMPQRDGLEILQALHASGHMFGIYVIMITSKRQGEDIAIALENGADDYLRKPFHPRELEARINVGVRTLQNESQLIEQNRLLDRFGNEMHNIAEERAKQLVHADRMATLGVMSAGIAHEINNSSAFISGNVQTLAKVWERLLSNINSILKTHPNVVPDKQLFEFVMEEVPGMLDGMRIGVSRIHSIVKGLSEYSRDDRGDMAQIDLPKCIDDALVICSNKTKRIKQINVIPNAVSGRIEGIGSQIEQVLVNLVGNAADALENTPDSCINIEIKQQDRCAQIIVSDNGPGVSEEVADRIFDPFFTTKGVGKGTGLGLAICSKIMTNHNGRLYVDHSYTDGARFVIELPVEEWKAAA